MGEQGLKLIIDKIEHHLGVFNFKNMPMDDKTKLSNIYIIKRRVKSP
jgi:hypothetical protein